MIHDLSSRKNNEGLTRISVRSQGDCYFVRQGGGPAVRVRKRGSRLDCECGLRECAHIASLRLCGFVEHGEDMQMAA